MRNLKDKLKQANSVQLTRGQIINILLYMTILIMPLLVVNVSIRRYSIAKIMFLYVVSIFLVINMILDKKIKFKKEYLVAILFLITIFVSSIFSPYKEVAFWGSAARNEGFITIMIYIILFIAASEYLKVSVKCINLILIVGSIHSFYGILQFFGFDPVQKWLLGEILMKDSIGLIGNRNFMSTYVLLFLVLSMAMYIKSKGEKKYLIYFLVLFTSFLCTLTRSGWLSFGIVSFIGFIFTINNKDYRKSIIVLLIFIITITIGMNILSDGKIIGRIQHTNEEIKTLSIKEEKTNSSINTRKKILELYIKVFKDSPFLGTGPDTFNMRIMDDYTKEMMELVISTGENTDKAHNEYLEYATSCSVFSLVLYVLLITSIIIKLIKNKSSNNKILILIISSYIIQALFNISVIAVAPLFWILLGYSLKEVYEKTSKI